MTCPRMGRIFRPSSGRQGGFSLIELMLALAVLGLMGAVVVVNLGGVTRVERLRAGARKVAGISDFARSEAASRKRTCYLEIDFQNSRFRFWPEPPRDRLGRYFDPEDESQLFSEKEIDEWKEMFDWEDLPAGVYFRRVWYSPRLYYEKGTISIEYRPNGTVDAYIVWLQAAGDDRHSEDGLWYSVVVNGLSGKSEVRDFAVNFPNAVESDFSEVMGQAPGSR